MKNLLLTLAVAVSMTGTALAGKPAASNMKVNAEKSIVRWEGKKVTGAHNGTIKVASGSLVVNAGKISGGEVTIDMTSIVCEDLKDAEYNKKFIGHMVSPDFFNVEAHKTAKLKITKVVYKGNTAEITGDLTIKGITKSITFPATVSMSGKVLKADGKMTIDRTNYDIKYGSGKFFDSLGDKVIYDDFTLEFSIMTIE